MSSLKYFKECVRKRLGNFSHLFLCSPSQFCAYACFSLVNRPRAKMSIINGTSMDDLPLEIIEYVSSGQGNLFAELLL